MGPLIANGNLALCCAWHRTAEHGKGTAFLTAIRIGHASRSRTIRCFEYPSPYDRRLDHVNSGQL